MYRRILVPLDGTPEAEAALAPARTLAIALSAEVVLISVVPTGGPSLKALESPDLRQAHDYLAGVAPRVGLTQAEDQVAVVVSEGSPAETIVAEAKAREADVIVMATHGRRGLERLVMGSVAERVLSTSPVPIVLIRPGAPRMQRLKLIVVPVDGSPESLVGVGSAAQLARAAHAAIVLLRVVEPLPLWLYDPTLGLNTGPLIDPRWDEGRRESAERDVRNLAASLANSGLEVGGEAVLGEVASEIAEYADQQAADLIVMATHARSGPARALLGSVADEVVRRARQPVLLVNRHMLQQSHAVHTSFLSGGRTLSP